MTRWVCDRSCFALTALIIGLTWSGAGNADDGSRKRIAEETAPVQSAAVPGNQYFDLRSHGDRFKLTIEAIEKESRKPRWNWDDGNKRFENL